MKIDFLTILWPLIPSFYLKITVQLVSTIRFLRGEWLIRKSIIIETRNGRFWNSSIPMVQGYYSIFIIIFCDFIYHTHVSYTLLKCTDNNYLNIFFNIPKKNGRYISYFRFNENISHLMCLWTSNYEIKKLKWCFMDFTRLWIENKIQTILMFPKILISMHVKLQSLIIILMARIHLSK